MHHFFLASYTMSFLGLFLTSIYGTMDALQYRGISNFHTVRRRVRMSGVEQRTHPIRKYANIYRTRKFRKRLMNEVNRINTKLRIRNPRQRYQLYHDANGEIRVRCK